MSETANGRSDGPDVVIVMTDQQRFDQIGYASAGHFETPNLDALAARGVIFERAYSAPMVRRGSFKYMCHLDRGQPVLFDLDSDPHESRNLVDEPGFESVRDDLAEEARLAIERPALDVAAPA